MHDLTEAFNRCKFRNEEEVDAYLDKCLIGTKQDLFIDILNMVKASDVMGLSYERCLMEIFERILEMYGDNDELTTITNCIIIKYLIAAGKGNFKEKEEVMGDYSNDEWYLDICKIVARNSKCLSRKIGAIVVVDKSIVSTGYNGPPRGVSHCGIRHQKDPKLLSAYKSMDKFFDEKIEVTKCPRQVLGFKSGEGLDWCVAGHGERNALINAAREGIKTKGTKLYMNCAVPCTPCLIEIINAGVEEIIVTGMTYYDISAEYVLKDSSLKCRVYDHLK
jgi:dCMP deaminase